jgi:exopolysaccharide biosynthesis polyprenyl glycosylphosphotransferase
MPTARHIRVTNQALDLSCILAALVATGLHSCPGAGCWDRIGMPLAYAGVFGLTWVFVTSRLDTYGHGNERGGRTALLDLLEAWGTTWGIGGMLAVSWMPKAEISMWLAFALGFALLGLLRLCLAPTALGARGDRPRTLVVGASPTARSLSTGREARRKMRFIGFVPFEGEDARQMPHLEQTGTMATLRSAFLTNRCDVVMVCPTDDTRLQDVHQVLRTCDEAGIGVHYFPPFLDLEHLHVDLTWADNHRGLAMRMPANQSLQQFGKRVIDVVGALAGITVLLPVLAVCAAAVKLTSKGPVFYRQERVGRNGEGFTCLKFRTMRVGADAMQEQLRGASVQDGPAFKIPDDPRVTPIGRMLRKFSLDELPQLINVLIGDMSLVGPRPPVPSEVAKYAWWQRRRISVKPGLTCVWQVWGRNRVSFKRWVEMDLYYIDNWSLWLDLKLICHTFRAVATGSGM